jgi:hypothetical protein
VSKVTILGATITNNPNDLAKNFDGKVQKITNICNHWSRFRLSLPGRILVAKTFMLSQIGYLGCIIQPTRDQIQTFESIINAFVKGRLQIAKDRMTLKLNAGGIGMINISHYITALQAAWIKKINGKVIDNWRRDLVVATGGNLFVLNERLLSQYESPILKQIAVSYNEVRKNFLSLDNNLLNSYLLYNPVLNKGAPDTTMQILKNNIPVLSFEQIASIKICDFWNNGIRPLDEICDNLGFNISLVTYMRVGQLLTRFRTKLVNRIRSPGIQQIFSGKVKGSKTLRNILYQGTTIGKNITQLRQVSTFFGLIGIPVPDDNMVQLTHTLWGNGFLTNRIREFSFKYFNNMLAVNARIAHFIDNQNPDCTLCGGGGGGNIFSPLLLLPGYLLLAKFSCRGAFT